MVSVLVDPGGCAQVATEVPGLQCEAPQVFPVGSRAAGKRGSGAGEALLQTCASSGGGFQRGLRRGLRKLAMSPCAGATACGDLVFPKRLGPAPLPAPLARCGGGSAPRCAPRAVISVRGLPRPSLGASSDPLLLSIGVYTKPSWLLFF